MGRPKKVIQIETGGETTGGYFRRVFKENPKLLVTRSNDELLARWLADHPGHVTVPPNIQKHLSNVKSIMSQEGPQEARQAEADRARRCAVSGQHAAEANPRRSQGA